MGGAQFGKAMRMLSSRRRQGETSRLADTFPISGMIYLGKGLKAGKRSNYYREEKGARMLRLLE